MSKDMICSAAMAIVMIFLVPVGSGAAAQIAGGCGSDLRPADVEKALRLLRLGAYAPPMQTGSEPYIVPLAMHVVRRSDGTGGISEQEVHQNISDANAAFAGANIMFCMLGDIIYIDGDHFYFDIDTELEIDQLRQTAVIPNAINVYFTKELALPGLPLCGISSFTFSGVQGIVMRNSCTAGAGNHSTFAHEIGHYFDLFHTHETGIGVECTDGSNCASAGDLICDTPADPQLGIGNVDSACQYTGTSIDPCGSGVPYSPDPSNHMSYAPHACRFTLTPQQNARAVATLVNLRPELLEHGCPDLSFPPTPGMHLLSVNANGSQAQGHSANPIMSADGAFFAFSSSAANLVPNDTNATWDVFVRDEATGALTMVSVSSTGVQGNAISAAPAISADGRYVAFRSSSFTLVPGAAAGVPKIYRHDQATGETLMASVNNEGVQAQSHCDRPQISADGRYIAFVTHSSNLVPDDTNGPFGWDIFLRDMEAGVTEMISINADGVQGNGGNGHILVPFGMTSDARHFAFHSTSTNLVENDSNGVADIFVRDRVTGEVTRVSVSSEGEQANGASSHPSISEDGRFVAFHSVATNLVPGDLNGVQDVFLHDRVTGHTRRISVTSAGKESEDWSGDPRISRDGRFVAFRSSGMLVPEDTDATMDAYVYDRVTGSIQLASPRGGAIGNANVDAVAMSADNAMAMFVSAATDLVPNDFNFATDIFGFDLKPVVPGDLTGDGVVGVQDLLALLSNWGECPVSPAPCPGDLAPQPGGDGVIGVADLLVLLANWG